MIFNIFVRYKHEIMLRKDAKPNQELDFVRYNREFVITVIVITSFGWINFKSRYFFLIYKVKFLLTRMNEMKRGPIFN